MAACGSLISSIPARLERPNHSQVPVRVAIKDVGLGLQTSGLVVCRTDDDGIADDPPQIWCLVLIGDHILFDSTERQHQVTITIGYSAGSCTFSLFFAHHLDFTTFVDSFTQVKLAIVKLRAQAIDRLDLLLHTIPRASRSPQQSLVPAHRESLRWTLRTTVERDLPRAPPASSQTGSSRGEIPPAYPGHASTPISSARPDLPLNGSSSVDTQQAADRKHGLDNSPPPAKRLRGLFGSVNSCGGLFASPPPIIAPLPAVIAPMSAARQEDRGRATCTPPRSGSWAAEAMDLDDVSDNSSELEYADADYDGESR